jgi:hypothetical protein
VALAMTGISALHVESVPFRDAQKQLAEGVGMI